MRHNYTPKDLRTLRLLHEYGFTDNELADHLGLSPLVIRHMRSKLELRPNGLRGGIVQDRRTFVRSDATQGIRAGMGPGAAGGVAMKLVDDRFFIEA